MRKMHILCDSCIRPFKIKLLLISDTEYNKLLSVDNFFIKYVQLQIYLNVKRQHFANSNLN